MKKQHQLENTLIGLESVKEYLQENDLNGIHLTNLPQHFWETLGECIDDIRNYIKLPINIEL